MTSYRAFLLPLALGATLAVSACDTAEDRAEGHYQSALALLESGDFERATVEFRNVFKLDGTHKEARRAYADALMDEGQVRPAIGQYLRLIEQYPNETDVRWILAETAIGTGNWDEVRRHGQAAVELDPDAPRSRVLDAAITYQSIKSEDGRDGLAPVVTRIRNLLEEIGPNDILLRMMVDYQIAAEDPREALPYLDQALALDSSAFDLQMAKFQILAQTGDEDGAGAHLEAMYSQFPEDTNVRNTLVAWYMARRDYDAAEAFLRELASDPTGPVEDQLNLVRFLENIRGADVTQGELNKLVEANAGTENAVLYAAMAATIDFQAGRQDVAIGKMQSVVANAPEGARKHEAQVVLARMLNSRGEKADAQALVDAVLAEDGGQVDALKLRAAWLIENDRPGEAVVTLRQALDQNPNDPDTLSLMASAHQREGNLELAIERLALAVEASNNAPEESLRYARVLSDQGRPAAAENVLNDALQRAPTNLAVLTALAQLNIQAAEWEKAEGVLARLEAIGTPQAETAARTVRAVLLEGQGRTEESLDFLMADIEGALSDSENTRSILLVVQANIRAGKLDEAAAFLANALQEQPGNSDLRLMSGAIDGLRGNLEAAETTYRDLMADFPENEAPIRQLLGLLAAQGRAEEARAVLADGLTRIPTSRALRMSQADLLQFDGDFEGAIALYQELYSEDSASTVLANNLASLLATHRSDPDSLERAFDISRRLRSVEVPAVQDTYGWIEYRRGNYQEALPYLESAAAGLPRDALVQYHLGMTYRALGRTEAARAQLTRALDLAGDSELPQFDLARETLAELDAPADQ